MKKALLPFLILAVTIAGANAQNTTYNFGATAQGAIAPADGSAWGNTTYLPVSNNGTVGLVSKNSSDGNVQLVSGGVSGFNGAYLKFNGGLSNAGSKFGIYNASASSTLLTAQFKVYFPASATNGRYVIYFGSGGNFASATGGISVGNSTGTGQVFASLQFRPGANSVTLDHWEYNSVTPANSKYVNDDFGPAQSENMSISKDQINTITLFMNNSADSETYTIGSSVHTLSSGTYDVWLNGEMILKGATTGGLAVGANLDDMNLLNVAIGASAPVMYFDDYIYSYSIDETVLPVTLALPLTAKPAGSNVILNWATATEVNSEKFEIFHSSDSQSFSKIGERLTSSPGGSKYSYTHNNAPAGTNYYKLKQLDKNGEIVEYGPVAASVALSANEFHVIMQHNSLEISLTSAFKVKNAQVVLYSITGNLIAEAKVNVQEGFNHYQIPATIPSGTYVLNINGGNIRLSKKVVKN